MPIYEYRCNICGRTFTLLVRNYTTPDSLVCKKCGQGDLTKLVSRFAVLRSEESRLESLADPSMFADVDENDPRSIARWARKMSKDLGEDLGDDFDEIVQRMEAGEMPDDFGGEEGDDGTLE